MVIEKVSAEMTFVDYVTGHLKTPFVWGQHDCVLFAAGWVRHHTGFDYLAGMPPWKSEKKARRLIRRMGGLEKIMDARFDRIHPNLARDGDIALYSGCLCLFSGAHIVGPNRDGLAFIDRTKAECAWVY